MFVYLVSYSKKQTKTVFLQVSDFSPSCQLFCNQTPGANISQGSCDTSLQICLLISLTHQVWQQFLCYLFPHLQSWFWAGTPWQVQSATVPEASKCHGPNLDRVGAELEDLGGRIDLADLKLVLQSTGNCRAQMCNLTELPSLYLTFPSPLSWTMTLGPIWIPTMPAFGILWLIPTCCWAKSDFLIQKYGKPNVPAVQ